jgi:hypothetical protein
MQKKRGGTGLSKYVPDSITVYTWPSRLAQSQTKPNGKIEPHLTKMYIVHFHQTLWKKFSVSTSECGFESKESSWSKSSFLFSTAMISQEIKKVNFKKQTQISQRREDISYHDQMQNLSL